MNKRIVITGIGVISPVGTGKEDFWTALKEGRSGIKPVTLFDTSTINSKLAGEITDFNPKAILGKKGLRNLDRTTLLAMAASQLTFKDGGIEIPIPEEDSDNVGVSLGSTLGSVWSISEFDKTALRDGPRGVNPALFPNTVINSPASHISIRFNIKGFNSTISTGFCSSLDALFYSMNMIELYDYHTVLVGGVEELCEQTYKGFYRIGTLAESKEGLPEISCPFDKRRNGLILGEGAAMFMLEELGHALGRDAHIYSEILGYGTSFDPKSNDICNPKAEGASKAISYCLEDAGIDASDIDYIAGCGNSTLDCDVMETRAIKNVFGEMAGNIPVSSIKSMIGETFSASGGMSLASVAGILNDGEIPSTVNYEKKDRRCDLNYVTAGYPDKNIKKVLINTFGPIGVNSSLVVGKYE